MGLRAPSLIPTLQAGLEGDEPDGRRQRCATTVDEVDGIADYATASAASVETWCAPAHTTRRVDVEQWSSNWSVGEALASRSRREVN